jgi:hypothetical protein
MPRIFAVLDMSIFPRAKVYSLSMKDKERGGPPPEVDFR